MTTYTVPMSENSSPPQSTRASKPQGIDGETPRAGLAQATMAAGGSVEGSHRKALKSDTGTPEEGVKAAPFGDRFTQVPKGLQAAIMMVAAAACFATMAALVRVITQDMHPFETAFFRNVFGLAFMLPWIMRGGVGQLRTSHMGLYALRGAIGVVAMFTWFYALKITPLGDAIALSFTTPLFATILAALVLRETVRMRRWTATAIGFIGMLIIVRPGFEDLGLGAGLVLISALAISAATIVVKTLSRTEDPNAIVTYMVLFLTPLSLIPALFFWTWPTAEQWGLCILMGLAGTAGHSCFTRAFRGVDASAVMPFDYARMPFAALLGFLLFMETPDVFTWIGAGVIAASSAYIAHRESVRAKSATS